MSKRHQEGLAHLLYGINHGGGFVALTGEVGTGKTTLCHCLLQQLPKNIDIALILNPKLNAIELLATICDELRVDFDHQRQSLKSLVDALNRYLLNAHANGRRTVLMIDEAQNLSLEVLEQIRLLTNLETTKTKLLQIILIGQPELKALLNRQELRQLDQRITARYHLLPLSLSETHTYIKHRLTICKGNPDLFNNAAINQIYQVSKGIPRVINIICHGALLGAYALDIKTITPKIIKQATQETLNFTDEPAPKNHLKILLGTLLLSALGAISYYLTNNPVPIEPTSLTTIFPTTNADPAITPPPAMVTANNKPAPTKAVEKPQLFSSWLNNPSFTFLAALTDVYNLWGKTSPTGQKPDCALMEANNLNCYFARGKWQDVIDFNRPAILEFSVAPNIKRYALLIGIKNEQALFRLGQDQIMTFPLTEVLSIWDGYYMLLWQSPAPGMKIIVPGQSSEHVLWLRQQLTVANIMHQDGKWSLYFDEALKSRVIAFQQSRHLTADGIVGGQTIIHLDNLTGAKGSPRLSQMK
jgi:general secretion pathway protein A